jgi:hypothetical protein
MLVFQSLQPTEKGKGSGAHLEELGALLDDISRRQGDARSDSVTGSVVRQSGKECVHSNNCFSSDASAPDMKLCRSGCRECIEIRCSTSKLLEIGSITFFGCMKPAKPNVNIDIKFHVV